MSGLDVTRALQATLPACRILMLTVYEDQAYLRQSLKLGGGRLSAEAVRARRN